MYIVTGIFCIVNGRDGFQFFTPQLTKKFLPNNKTIPEGFKLKSVIEAPGFTDLIWGEHYLVTALVDGEINMALSKQKVIASEVDVKPVKIVKVEKKMFKKIKTLSLHCNYE